MTIKSELKLKFKYEFCRLGKQNINYSLIHVYLYRLLCVYYYVVSWSVTVFILADLPNYNVTIRELCNLHIKLWVGAVLTIVILWQWNFCTFLLKIVSYLTFVLTVHKQSNHVALHEDCSCRFTHDLGNVYCGDYLNGRIFNTELWGSHISFIYLQWLRCLDLSSVWWTTTASMSNSRPDPWFCAAHGP